MKRKNMMTSEEAEKLYDKLKETKPSKKMQKWINDYIMRNLHAMYQYRMGKERWCYCTHCHKHFPIENKRSVTPEDRLLLEAKHNDKVICPKCGYEVTKRYAGITPKDITAVAAEFKVGAGGELLCFIYRFDYNLSEMSKDDFQFLGEVKMDCELVNIFYYDIHQYFHMLYGGFGGQHPYLGDRYTSELNIDLGNEPLEESKYYKGFLASVMQGVKHFALHEALKNSNLKYCPLDKYENLLRPHCIYDLLKFFKFYSSYPEITERMIKQGYGNLIYEHLYGYKQCKFHFTKKTVHEFLGLKKEEMADLNRNNAMDRRLSSREIEWRQFVHDNGIVFNDESERLWLRSNMVHKDTIEKMLNFCTLHKAIKYLEEQRTKYAPCSRAISLTDIFIEYNDYLKMAKDRGLDLSLKGNMMPQNVFSAHNELITLNEKERIAAEKEIDKKFKREFLKKYIKKYSFEKDGLLIRPANDSQELYIESSALHHCVYAVYRDMYYQGKTVIMVIRRQSAPETPFYTLEYKNGSVIQCRGFANCGTTEKIDDFIKSWKEFLKQKQTRKVS